MKQELKKAYKSNDSEYRNITGKIIIAEIEEIIMRQVF